MNPQAARRELFSSGLVLMRSSSLAAVTAFSAALGSGFGSGVAGGTILLLCRAGREKHGGSSQSDGKETDHRKVSVGNAWPTKAGACSPSAYLLYWTGAGGGGGGGLEAQETTTIEAARARSAYFIVWCSLCLLLFTRPVQGHMEYLRNNNEPVFCKQANQPEPGKY